MGPEYEGRTMSVTHRTSTETPTGVICGQFTTNIKRTETDQDSQVTCKKCLWLMKERDTSGEGIEITSEATGEVQTQKPYRSEEHLGFGGELVAQQRYIRKMLRDPEDPNTFANLSPEQIIDLLDHLSAYYDRLGAWLANQTLWHSDLKTARQLKFAQLYLKWKRTKGETNETARMEATIAVHELDVGIDKCKGHLDTVGAWKKSIGRYHDGARSQLSYEKQAQYMQGRNDNTREYRR